MNTWFRWKQNKVPCHCEVWIETKFCTLDLCRRETFEEFVAHTRSAKGLRQNLKLVSVISAHIDRILKACLVFCNTGNSDFEAQSEDKTRRMKWCLETGSDKRIRHSGLKITCEGKRNSLCAQTGNHALLYDHQKSRTLLQSEIMVSHVEIQLFSDS